MWLTPRRARVPVVMAPAPVTATWVSPTARDGREALALSTVTRRGLQGRGAVGPRVEAAGRWCVWFPTQETRVLPCQHGGTTLVCQKVPPAPRPHHQGDGVEECASASQAGPAPAGLSGHGTGATSHHVSPAMAGRQRGGSPRGGGAGGSELLSCMKRAEWLFPGNTLRTAPSLENCAVPSPTSGSSSGDRDGRKALSCRTVLGTGRERVCVFARESATHPRSSSRAW